MFRLRRKTYLEQLRKVPIDEVRRLNRILEEAMKEDIVLAILIADKIIDYIMNY